MKHSWLRLFSSVYILLVSVLLIVISAYAWVVISTSPTAGGAGFGVAGRELWNIPLITFDEVWKGEINDIPEQDENGAYIITNGAELWYVVNLINNTEVGDLTMIITQSIDMASAENMTLPSIYVDGYHGDGVITVIGQTTTAEDGTTTGKALRLTNPLFSGGFAGESGIVIKGIIIANSNITSTNTFGSGAFIDSVDSMQTITLEDCHLISSTLTGGEGARTGGLIGYTAGYNNVNDGPVKTYVTVKDCSVENCVINSDGSAGGAIGHSGGNAWTYSVLENCTVTNTKIVCADDGGWRVGEIVGTANVGEMVIKNSTTSGNSLNQTQASTQAAAGQSTLYGRLVLGDTGSFSIIESVTENGTTSDEVELWGVFTQLAADNAKNENQTWTLYNEVTLGGEIRFQGSNITVKGANTEGGEKATITLDSVASGYSWQGQSGAASGFNFGLLNDYTNDVKEGTAISFSNIIFNNEKTADETCSTTANRSVLYTYAYTETVSYGNCDFNGGVVTYGNASFTGCTFDESDDNMYCLFFDNEYGGRGTDLVYSVSGCTFNGNSSSYGGLKVADDAESGAKLTVSNSYFSNIVNKAAIYVNGKTAVYASGNEYSNCAVGAIGFKGTKCTLNGVPVTTDGYVTSNDGINVSDMNFSTTTTTTATTAATTTAQTTTVAPTEITSTTTAVEGTTSVANTTTEAATTAEVTTTDEATTEATTTAETATAAVTTTTESVTTAEVIEEPEVTTTTETATTVENTEEPEVETTTTSAQTTGE